MYLHVPPRAPHTYDFVVLTSLTHPCKILLVVLQTGKAKDLSAPLRVQRFRRENDVLFTYRMKLIFSYPLCDYEWAGMNKGLASIILFGELSRHVDPSHMFYAPWSNKAQ
jgi:hypothetical protein